MDAGYAAEGQYVGQDMGFAGQEQGYAGGGGDQGGTVTVLNDQAGQQGMMGQQGGHMGGVPLPRAGSNGGGMGPGSGGGAMGGGGMGGGMGGRGGGGPALPPGQRYDTQSIDGKLFLGGLDISSTKDSVVEYCQQWWVAGGRGGRVEGPPALPRVHGMVAGGAQPWLPLQGAGWGVTLLLRTQSCAQSENVEPPPSAGAAPGQAAVQAARSVARGLAQEAKASLFASLRL